MVKTEAASPRERFTVRALNRDDVVEFQQLLTESTVTPVR